MRTQVHRQHIVSGDIDEPVSREQIAKALRNIADQLDQPFSPQPSYDFPQPFEAWFSLISDTEIDFILAVSRP